LCSLPLDLRVFDFGRPVLATVFGLLVACGPAPRSLNDNPSPSDILEPVLEATLANELELCEHFEVQAASELRSALSNVQRQRSNANNARTLHSPTIETCRSDLQRFEGDKFPTVIVRCTTRDPRYFRLDPPLRNNGAIRINRIALSPSGSGVGVTFSRQESKPNGGFVVWGDASHTPNTLPDGSYDIVWGESDRNLFFSTTDHVQPNVVAVTDLDTNKNQILKTSSTPSTTLLLARGPQGKNIVVVADTLASAEITVYRGDGNPTPRTQVSLPIYNGPNSITVDGDVLSYIDYQSNPSGVIINKNVVTGRSSTIWKGDNKSTLLELASIEHSLLVRGVTTYAHFVSAVSEHGIQPLETVNQPASIKIVRNAPLQQAIASEPFLDPPMPGVQDIVSVARSKDDTEVPFTLLLPKSPRAIVIDVYGSYGVSVRPSDPPFIRSLLGSGIGFGIVQVRGGGEKGPAWHLAAIGANKIRSIEDLKAAIIAIQDGAASKGVPIFLHGKSAGGWLVLQTSILYPKLAKGVLAESPITDLIHAIATGSPFYERERLEWGPPSPVLERLSPFQSLQRGALPNILLSVATNDELTPYDKSLNFISKARNLATNDPLILYKLFRDGGHDAPASDYDREDLTALQIVFINKIIRNS